MALYVYVCNPYLLSLFTWCQASLVTRNLSISCYCFFVRRPLKSWSPWGAVWIFYASGKYKFCRRQAKRAETANYFSANQNWHPVITALVSSKMNPTGTKTFTSEWVLVFGRLIIRMWDVLTVCCSPVFIILRGLISGNIERLAPGNTLIMTQNGY